MSAKRKLNFPISNSTLCGSCKIKSKGFWFNHNFILFCSLLIPPSLVLFLLPFGTICISTPRFTSTRTRVSTWSWRCRSRKALRSSASRGTGPHQPRAPTGFTSSSRARSPVSYASTRAPSWRPSPEAPSVCRCQANTTSASSKSTRGSDSFPDTSTVWSFIVFHRSLAQKYLT